MAIVVLAFNPLGQGATANHDVYFGSSYAHPCDRTPSSQCITNNIDLYYNYLELSKDRGDAMDRAFLTWGVNSDINVHKTMDTDVLIIQELRPDVDAFAWGQCAASPTTVTFGGSDAAHTRYCYPQWIYWNIWSAAANKVNTQARTWYVACHESGHTIGLRHRSTTPATCMIGASKPPSDPTSVVPSVTDPAFVDITRINLHY
ncbi:MAG: hypothetical protein ACRD3J_28850 [Thermoanaerobaculia bacterium]